ncbi:magnesium-translocating P-type ATPase [Clostridium sp.]|uniref:magnesium-translocating P-type ATPase n=1 Tax=Clostridium sp. TaxID=1506 RepID=UPI003991552D
MKNKNQRKFNEDNYKKISNELIKNSNLSKEDLLSKFNCTENGLNSTEVEKRIEKYGFNEINENKKDSIFMQFIKSFMNYFNLVLVLIAIISYFTNVVLVAPGQASWSQIIIIIVLILVSGIISFTQEFKSGLAAEELKNLVTTTCSVKRDGKDFEEIDMKNLVVGDIVKLAAGDMIPADLRILECKDLFISQSALTGESEAIEKFSYNTDSKNNIGDLSNICLLGTNVISGSALGAVIGTGETTYFGSMQKNLNTVDEQTSFDKSVEKISKLLLKFMLVMVPIVFVINWIDKGSFVQALLFAVSVAVGLTPVMLPTIVSANLAKGAVKMSKKKTVVKKLKSIQNFGAMDVLCTDKTGTLTEDKIIVEKHLNLNGEEDHRVLMYGYLNSSFQTGLKNLMDLAIIEFGKAQGFKDLDAVFDKIDEIPFDFNRRRMSVILKGKEENQGRIITKGALEEMLSISKYVELNGHTYELTKERREKVLSTSKKLNAEGMRVIGVAKKDNMPLSTDFGIKDESEMTLIGFIAFLDPPKESAKTAIKALNNYGVDVKILTGDNEIVTKKVCSEVGLNVNNIVLGNHIDDLSDKELFDLSKNTNVFAKLNPMQKARIVRVLKENGKTVGFMGDGINDAIALKESDVGISVDTAVDIAKEAADIILLEKDLMVLEEGVIEGRKIFANITKYLKMTISSNFGNTISVMVASIFLPFLPMLPLEILLQTLIYDITQIVIPWDKVDEEYLKVPRKWDGADIVKFTVIVGPTSSIFDQTTFLLMWFVFGCTTAAKVPMFQTAWFIEGLATQVLVVYMLRTEKVPFFQSNASWQMNVGIIVSLAIGWILPYTAIGSIVGMVPVPLIYFAYIAFVIVAYCTLTQFVKMWYIKRYKNWL